jgi:hypothetical protein
MGITVFCCNLRQESVRMKNKNSVMLYPENMDFLKKKRQNLVHYDEIMHNIEQINSALLKSQVMILAIITAVIAPIAAIASFVATFRNYTQPTCFGDVACIRPATGVLGAIFFTAILAVLISISLILWVIKVYPLLKYPTLAERYYHLIFDFGKPSKGYVKSIKVLNEEKICIYYTYAQNKKEGKYYSFSPTAKTLNVGDVVAVYCRGDFSVLL